MTIPQVGDRVRVFGRAVGVVSEVSRDSIGFTYSVRYADGSEADYLACELTVIGMAI